MKNSETVLKNEEVLNESFTKWFFILLIIILTFATGVNVYKINAKKEIIKTCLKGKNEPKVCYQLVKDLGLIKNKSKTDHYFEKNGKE